MNGLKVRLARGLNKLMVRRGSVFADRYHARPLRTPREARWALRYVLGNDRHHDARGWARDEVDTRSSAPFFDGWDRPVRFDRRWLAALAPHRPPPARSWLLRTGWLRHGRLDPNERPGAARAP